jgi:hypothetical protein
MRTVTVQEDGVLELNWMWLPTWVGMNTSLKTEMEASLRSKIEGKELTDKVLDEVNDLVIEFLCAKCPLAGLRDYLDGLKFVRG